MDEQVAKLVLIHGRAKAKEMLPGPMRPLADIAAEVLADEHGRIGISYSGFALTALPHKRLPDEQAWERHGHRVTLLVEPGRMRLNGRPIMLGVPYGARARMILLYLMSESIRTGSREVILGRHMADWMSRMGITPGGETAKALKDQARRISACSLKFFWQDVHGREEGWRRGAVVEGGLTFSSDPGEQATLFDERVVLDETFWRALREHPVPLREQALRQLADRSMSLDVYVWLAYRLHQMEKVTHISWVALHGQFGAGYAQVRQFRVQFCKALAATLAAYPEARVTEIEGGLALHPSPPPVPKSTLRAISAS